MKQFAGLLADLENTPKTSIKVALLKTYFSTASDQDKVWAVALFTGRKPKRQVNTRQLTDWALECTGMTRWLFEESYQVVGDLAETLALLIASDARLEARQQDTTLSHWMDFLLALEGEPDEVKQERVTSAWGDLGQQERLVFNKLITGGFRVGVSDTLVARALAELTGQEQSAVVHQLMGAWQPDEVTFSQLLSGDAATVDHSKPYPFYLAYALDQELVQLGDAADWSAEWKWDGIRVQLIVRGGQLYLWSRGEELITDKFPELSPLAEALPEGTVIDGELLPYRDGQPLPFALLQTRIGRKAVSKRQLAEAPARIIAYDLLEWDGVDMRALPFAERRAHLAKVVGATDLLLFSESLTFGSWQELTALRERSREYHAEGLMLKRLDSAYLAGRKRGDWWKWKTDPYSVDAVLVYAQKGHGRRADLYSDYTFALWDGEVLVPFAKAYSGLTDQEIAEVTRFVRQHTLERFGPVRTVEPRLVFEIHFEGINASPRHKSGIAVRFPRIHRWRRDKQPSEANTLEDLKALVSDG